MSTPYERYKDILLDDTYGSARKLQDFVLHQFKSYQFPFDINQHLGGFDTKHREISFELKQWLGEGPCPQFHEVVDVIIARRRAPAQSNAEQLARLRTMSPESYPCEEGETPTEAYHSALAHCQWHQKRYAEMGFPVE